MVSQKSEIEYLQEKLKIANEKLSENRSTNNGSSEKSILTSADGKHKVGTFVILRICQHLAGKARDEVKKQTAAFTSLPIFLEAFKKILCAKCLIK